MVAEMKKFQVLIRDADDWREVYADGKLIYEGHDSIQAPSLRILEELKQYGFEIDIRIMFVNVGLGVDETKVPLHCFTNETYWYDWDVAKPFIKRS